MLSRTAKIARSLLALRRADWLLASFPKSGNTWVRFILANYLLSSAGIEEPCQTFAQLDDFLPEFGDGRLRQQWRGQRIDPMLVKTHRRFWFGFRGIPAMLIVRNPGDVMVSYFHFQQRLGLWDGTFSDFIRAPGVGIQAWVEHYLSWAGQARTIVSYESLKTDAGGAITSAMSALGMTVDPEILSVAVERSEASRIRRREEQARSHGDFVFLRDGNTAQWKGQFSDADMRFANDLLPDQYLLA